MDLFYSLTKVTTGMERKPVFGTLHGAMATAPKPLHLPFSPSPKEEFYGTWYSQTAAESTKKI
jgi:hypothetical protein